MNPRRFLRHVDWSCTITENGLALRSRTDTDKFVDPIPQRSAHGRNETGSQHRCTSQCLGNFQPRDTQYSFSMARIPAVRLRSIAWVIVAGWILGFASKGISAVHSESFESPESFDPCRHHMHALISYLKETAELEGKVFAVEWQADGSAMVHCTDSTQYMWCQDGELHIRLEEPTFTREH